ncbi:MAG: sugar kinase [Candidatus Eisenbacteria bacterium]|nr:sugar kinase [Candidatus Latescibacterota bacterium]MBD3302785.1 sugar kinase [Candidatus Eisenbacteria bacterium]
MSEVVVVGSVAFDTIATPTGRHERMIGGSASYFSLAARLYVPVRLVGVVGSDFEPRHRKVFEDRRIDLSGLQVRDGKTFYWEGVYGEDLNDRTTVTTELNVFESFHPELPDAFRRSKAVFLANIDPVLQHEVLEQLDSPDLVALDTMNFWITHQKEDLLRVLRGVHLFLLNDAEARQLTGAPGILEAAEGIQMMGPTVVVIKRGEYGALARTEKGWFSIPAYPVGGAIDPTGCGDSFAGGMIGSLLRQGSLDESAIRTAMAHGTAMASFAVERFGLAGLEAVTEESVRQRVRALAEMTRFDPE